MTMLGGKPTAIHVGYEELNEVRAASRELFSYGSFIYAYGYGKPIGQLLGMDIVVQHEKNLLEVL